MKTIFCIVGETGSGKDTVARKLCDATDLVVSTTDRPKRNSELNGREHLFVSAEEVDRLMEKGEIAAYTKTGKYRYCATVEDLENKLIYIINPDGIRYLKNTGVPGLRVVVIGLFVSLEERRSRCKGRSDYNSSFDKRVSDEQLDYSTFLLNGEFDYLVNNKKLETTVEAISRIINLELNNK